LGLNASYDATIIPALVTRQARKLLRDYNFQKSLTRQTYAAPQVVATYPSFDLPAGAGKILGLRFNDPTNNTWSDMLKRRESFVLPNVDPTWQSVDGIVDLSQRRYWQEGTKLYLAEPIDASLTGLNLVLWYQTVEPASATWIYDDFEDVLFTLSVYRGAAENRKPEVQQAYQALWAEDMQSLAIYLNELEFDNLEMVQREERTVYRDRYPIS
jgi:hypothetical protein